MVDYASVCQQAALAGAAVLQQWVGKFKVRTKGRFDLVTEADLAAQEAIRNVVLGAFPDHGFIGEEGGSPPAGNKRQESPEYQWIVDPLDGTTNYVHGVPHYATSVALVRGNQILVGAIVDPNFGECFTAEAGRGAKLNGKPIQTSAVLRLADALVAASLPAGVDLDFPSVHEFLAILPHAQAIRRGGSAALNLAYIAAGRFDSMWAADLFPWDVAAGALLVEEAGGVLTALDGGVFDLWTPKLVAACTPSLQREMLATLRKKTPA